DAGRLDVQALAVRLGDLELLVAVHPAVARELAQSGGGDVAPHVLDEVEPVAFAVLRDVGDAVADRLAHGAQLDLLAAQVDPPGDVPPVAAAEQAHRQLGAAGTHEARDADDLAGPDVEARAVDDHAPGLGGVVHRPVLDPEHLLPDLRRPLGVAVLEVAADHRADD